MLSWSLQSRRVRPHLSAVALLAALAHGGEPTAAPISPHPLVAAAEWLYQQGLPLACDELVQMSSVASGLTEDDFIHLHFLTALRALDQGNELAAQSAVAQALQINRSAELPPFASKLGKVLGGVRARLPPKASSKDRDARLADARKALGQREPVHQALLRAVDALYMDLQIDGAVDVLDLARSSSPMTASDRAQIALRHGVLRMETADENAARVAFREALEADRGVVLPSYAPPKTVRVFEEVKRAVTALGQAPAPAPRSDGSVAPPAPLGPAPKTGNLLMEGRRPWGLAAGGTGLALVAGGVLSGTIARSSYEAEERASMEGNYDGYIQHRDAAITARNVANGLYGVGAVALGVGAYLFFLAPGEVSVGAGVGQGRASLAIGGNF